MFYVLLTTGMIVRSKSDFLFTGGWSQNTDVHIRQPNVHEDPNYGFYSAIDFSFRKDAALAYWSA
jgi:hypothetical protein